jgi:hypothetical protein
MIFSTFQQQITVVNKKTAPEAEWCPDLYKATAALNTAPADTTVLGPFTSLEDAQHALFGILDDWHEGIAFESDADHKSLDRRFISYSSIEVY